MQSKVLFKIYYVVMQGRLFNRMETLLNDRFKGLNGGKKILEK